MEVKKFLAISVPILLIVVLLFMGAASVSASKPEDLKKAREWAEENLLPVEGITGISHAEEPARLIVYIENEKFRSKVPQEIKGFKTEVVVVGRIKALSVAELESPAVSEIAQYVEPVSRTGVVRPIVGGVSCGVPEEDFGGKMAGTLGIVTPYDDYILSCAHVIAMDKNANFLPIDTTVLQPGTYDGGTLDNSIGKLHKYISITFGYKGKNYADAAIATIDTGIDYLKGELLAGDNQNTYSIDIHPTDVIAGDAVRKSGRTTEVTTGSVTDTQATVRVWYTSTKYAKFYDQILVVQPFIDSGDSGSLVDKGGGLVGLAFAGSDTIAVICKAKYIIDGLGIALGPPAPDIDVSPTSIDFGNVQVNSPSSPQTVTVSNVGNADLTVGTITITGTNANEFSIQNDYCSGQKIVAGGSATLEVVFTPTSEGAKSASLFIPSNDPDEPTVTVALSGTGVTGAVAPTAEIVIDMSKQVIATKYWRATAALTVTSSGAALAGATINGEWSGIYTGTVSGTTDENGKVSFTTGLIKTSGAATFTVNSIVKDSVEYTLSGETSDSVSGP